MKYAWPCFDGTSVIFFRLGGPGLGNLLFPWARALVKAEQSGWQLMAPVWPQVKIGPWLRREPDKRFYGNIFAPHSSEVDPLQSLFLRRKLAVIEEGSDETSQCFTMRFSGMRNQFAALVGHHATVNAALHSRARNIPNAEDTHLRRTLTIGVHIRLGDFSRPQSDSVKNLADSVSTPIQWYIQIIQKIQSITNKFSYEIHSDGTDEELGDLLRMQQVTRAKTADALSAILRLSQSRAIIASGSTFSRWAIFLGQTPAIYFPGQLYQRVIADSAVFEEERFSSDFSTDDVKAFLQLR